MEPIQVRAVLKDELSGPWKRAAESLNDGAQAAHKELTSLIPVLAGAGGAVAMMTKFLKDGAAEFLEEEKASARLNVQLRATGAASGMTKQSLNELTESIKKQVTYGEAAIKNAERMVLRFTNIGKDVFPLVIQTAADMSDSEEDLASNAQMLAMALEDPEQGMMRLRRAGIILSDSQKELIKTYQDHGDMANAQKVIIDEISGKFEGGASAALDTYSGKWELLKRNVVEAGSAMVSFALETDAERLIKTGNIDKLKDEAARLRKELEAGVSPVRFFFNQLLSGIIGTTAATGLEKQANELGKLNKAIELANKDEIKANEDKKRILEIQEKEKYEKLMIMHDKYSQFIEDRSYRELEDINKMRKEEEDKKDKQEEYFANKLNMQRKKMADDRLAREKKTWDMEIGFVYAYGNAIARGIGQGAEGWKESFKGILEVTLDFMEKLLITDEFIAGARALYGDFTALLQLGAIHASFAVAKAGIESFQTAPGQTRVVPGSYSDARMAIVHGGERIGRGDSYDNSDNSTVQYHFHIPGGMGGGDAKMIVRTLESLARKGYLNNAYNLKAVMAR